MSRSNNSICCQNSCCSCNRGCGGCGSCGCGNYGSCGCGGYGGCGSGFGGCGVWPLFAILLLGGFAGGCGGGFGGCGGCGWF